MNNYLINSSTPSDNGISVCDADSLANFLEWVNTQQEQLNKFNTTSFRDEHYELYFRGVSNYAYDDIPSIFRNIGFIRDEEKFINECLTQKPNDFVEEKSTFDILVKMQHYGIPTRLLDITKDPLVALYFATCSGISEQTSGKVTAYFISKKQIHYPDSPVVATLSNLTRQNYTSWSWGLNRKESFKELLSIAKKDSIFPNDNLIQEDLQRIFCVKPKMNNDRIVRQNGAFLLFGLIGAKECSPRIIPLNEALEIISVCVYYRGLVENDFEGEKKENALLFLDVFFQKYSDFEAQWVDFKENLSLNDDCAQYLRNHDIDQPAENFKESFLDYIQTKNEDLMGRIEFLAGEIKYAPELGNLEMDSGKYAAHLGAIANLSQTISANNLILDLFWNKGFIAKNELRINKKEKISIQLSNIGVTKSKLFPELEVLAETLKNSFARNIY